MQRGRSRKQQAPHRAPMDSGIIINAAEKKHTKQPKQRRSRAGKGPTTTPVPRFTPSPAASPPASPDTPIMDSNPPSNTEAHPEGTSDPEHEAFTASAQAGAPYNMMMAPAQPTAEFMMAAAATMYANAPVQHTPSKSVKRKQAPSAAGATAGGFGSSKGAKRPKSGPGSLPLKSGYCNFCGETSSPMWRKGSEQYPRLCNRCGMRWSRNRNDHDKAFNAKVLAKIKAERLREQVAAELITEDSGFSISEAFAAAGPFDHVYSHPASAHAPSRLGAPQQASPAYPALLCSYPTDPDMEVAAAAAAAAAGDSDSQETGQDAAAGEEGDGVERSAEPAGRSHRARRATEKGLALQSHVRRSRTPRKAAGGEARVNRTAFLDLAERLYSEFQEMHGGDDYDNGGQYSDDYEEAEDYEDYEEEPRNTKVRGQPAPSRLARTTFADAGKSGNARAAAAGGPAGGKFRGLEALLAAASADMEDGAEGEMMSDDNSGLEAPAAIERAQLLEGTRAVSHAQQNIAQAQQAAASAHLTATNPAGNTDAAASFVAQLMQRFGPAQHANAAAPAAPAALPQGPTGGFIYPAQQQLEPPQQLHQHQHQALQVMQQYQPGALQLVLQQPALLAPAGILLQAVNLGAAPNLPMFNPQPQMGPMQHVNQPPVHQPPVQPVGQPHMASDLVRAAAMLGNPHLRQAFLEALAPQLTALIRSTVAAPARSGDSDGAAFDMNN